MSFARLNGITIHYRQEGHQDRPAIVFANSLGTDFRIWDEVVAALAGEFRILRYDKRGHGLSDAPPAPYRMAEHVADLDALMGLTEMEGALVVGLSVGGLIAQGFASLHPARVRALVLSNTAHKIGTAEMWNARIAAIEADGIGSIAGQILERWFTPGYRSPANPDFSGYANMLVRTPVAGYVGTIAAIRDTDYTEATGQLTLPVRCIVGDQDGSTPPDLVRTTAELVRGEFHVIAGAGHIPCVEKPAETAALIREFAVRHLDGGAAA